MVRQFSMLLCFLFLSLSCSTDSNNVEENGEMNQDPEKSEEDNNTNSQINFKLLALGDSYTIGQGVCNTCSFPEQLKSKLKSEMGANKNFDLKIIAQTGWSTTNLIRGINNETLTNNYDLVTLLIGVNNQFQGTAFSTFEGEFKQLINKSIALAKSQKSNIIVLSIPDYSFTPVGSNYANVSSISSEIDTYNQFIESYCDSNSIEFINITDISRTGLTNSSIVADDGLHLSSSAYGRVVNRLLPIALEKLKN